MQVQKGKCKGFCLFSIHDIFSSCYLFLIIKNSLKISTFSSFPKEFELRSFPKEFSYVHMFSVEWKEDSTENFWKPKIGTHFQ